MHGIHDLGGMHGFGPINPEPESTEPVFHHPWEARVYAITRSLALLKLWNIDMSRHARERQNPIDYLRNSYYESWLAGLSTQLLESELLTPDELASGRPNSPAPKTLRDNALRPEQIPNLPLAGPDYNRPAQTPPRFQPGDAVRARNQRVPGHTRQPRYTLGRTGTIHENYGAHIYPDLSAQGLDQPSHLYSVRFTARELWGDSADPASTVYLDLFEDYLEPAP